MGRRGTPEQGWHGTDVLVDELPGGLSFARDLDDDHAAPPRRGVRALVWVLVTGVLLGGGGAYASRWYAESDVRAVLASSTTTYGGVLARLRDAADAEALAAAAVGAPGAADRLDADLARLSRDGGTRRAAVAAQVSAERDVLRAVGALGEVDRAPLRVWGEAHEALSAAVRREQATRSSLLLVDAASANRLPDTTAAVRRVAATVGEAVVGDVTRAAADLLTELEAAARTADLRAAAERASAQRTAVSAAGRGLGGGPDAAVLTAFGDALLAVTELSALAPDATGVWPSVRGRLQESLRVVADADGGLAAGTVRGRLPLVLDAVDRLVRTAEQEHAAWVPVRDAALAAQSADDDALRRYGEQVRSAAGSWSGVERALDDLARRPGDVALADDAWVRADGVRRALAASLAPEPVVSQHSALLEAVARVERPLRARREDPEAPAPPLPSTSGWEPALAAWEAALTAVRNEVAARPVPPAPDV